jgi:hypothetical protein
LEKRTDRFCLQLRGVGKRSGVVEEGEVGVGAGRRNDPNNVCTYEYMNKEKTKITKKEITCRCVEHLGT